VSTVAYLRLERWPDDIGDRPNIRDSRREDCGRGGGYRWVGAYEAASVGSIRHCPGPAADHSRPSNLAASLSALY